VLLAAPVQLSLGQPATPEGLAERLRNGFYTEGNTGSEVGTFKRSANSLEIHPGAVGAKTRVKCDALLMDDRSASDTKPTMKVDEQRSTVEHEASVSKIGEEQLFYAMSRGMSEADATAMIVNGFFDFFVKELPMEYAVELNRLIKMEMEGSVG